MSTMLLEGCACAAKIATCSCVHEVATSGIDLEIARLVCDTIVCVLLIFVLGALAWRLIDHHATKKVTIRKRRWDYADREARKAADLLERQHMLEDEARKREQSRHDAEEKRKLELDDEARKRQHELDDEARKQKANLLEEQLKFLKENDGEKFQKAIDAALEALSGSKK